MNARHLAAATALVVAAAACGPAGMTAVGTADNGAASRTQAPPATAPTAVPDQVPTAERTPAAGDTEAPAGDTNPVPAVEDFPEGVAPERIVIPALGVDATVIDLGLNADRSVEVPSDYDESGWVEHTPRPGQFGASVIVGHVDSRSGPAVFFRLRELSSGDEIHVHGSDGTQVTFTVDRVARYSKAEFPFDEVFGYVRQPTLRLVTCGGEFNQIAGSYLDNIVVYAQQAGATT